MYPSVIVVITLLSSMTLSDARAIDNPCTAQKFPSLITQLSITMERIVLTNVAANQMLVTLVSRDIITWPYLFCSSFPVFNFIKKN